MNNTTNYKYHSTAQFRNVVQNVRNTATFRGIDEEGNPVFDHSAEMPKIHYIGTVKLHGTNGSIIIHEDGVVSFHSKNNLLGYAENGEFTLLNDNSEFAQTMFRRFDVIKELVEDVKVLAKGCYGANIYPIKISGEWCGQGIQKGVGVSFLGKRSFFIFGVKVGETSQELKQGWLPVDMVSEAVTQDCNLAGIYAITDFPTKEIIIDFSIPEQAVNYMVEVTKECEACCPVSEALDLKDPEGIPQRLGEGYVWTPSDVNLCWDSGMWFKTKGEKHSVSKVKTLVEVDAVKLASIQEFVEYAVTENRLAQGITEIGLDKKLVGKFLSWVAGDINKEEGDVLEKNGLSMRDVGKYINDSAKKFYFSKLNNF